jgi:hypothetical protein
MKHDVSPFQEPLNFPNTTHSISVKRNNVSLKTSCYFCPQIIQFIVYFSCSSNKWFTFYLVFTLNRTCEEWIPYSNVAYLLKARIVEAEKQSLLGNGPYTRSRGKRHVRFDVTQQYKRRCKRRYLWVRAELVATQLCYKHISAAVNQNTAIEKAVFSMGPSRGYSQSDFNFD